MKNLLELFRRGHKPDADALSALADGALPGAEARALEAHVAGCDACRTQLDGMRQVRTMLAAMPRAEAPRSFRLRQADVEAAQPVRARPSVAPRLVPALSALGMIVFAVALGADITSNDGGQSNGSNDSVSSFQSDNPNAYSPDALESDARANQPAAAGVPPEAETAADNAGGADEGAQSDDDTNNTGADGGETQIAEGLPKVSDAATAAADTTAANRADLSDGTATREELEAASAIDTSTDDGDGLGALFIIEIAALAVALGAGAVAVSMWARRRGTI